jgi:hypothetical protein
VDLGVRIEGGRIPAAHALQALVAALLMVRKQSWVRLVQGGEQVESLLAWISYPWYDERLVRKYLQGESLGPARWASSEPVNSKHNTTAFEML